MTEPKSPDAVMDRLTRDFQSLVREYHAIHELSLGAQPKFYMSLYAMLMGAFAQVDLLSRLWRGTDRDQTGRMNDFLSHFTARSPAAIRIAVQLYRHTLMHTGRPRELLDSRTKKRHYFRLHWGREAADPAAHFTLDADGKLILNLEMLLEDLQSALDGFTNEVASDNRVADNVQRAWPQVALQAFSARAV